MDNFLVLFCLLFVYFGYTIFPKTIKQNEIQIKVARNSPIEQSVTLTPEDIGTWKIVGEAITITTEQK